jgi:hypothetical protein
MNGLLTLAFTAGLLAPVNPCGFALLPAYLGYTAADQAEQPVSGRLARALGVGAALGVGFAATLGAAGLAIWAGTPQARWRAVNAPHLVALSERARGSRTARSSNDPTNQEVISKPRDQGAMRPAGMSVTGNVRVRFGCLTGRVHGRTQTCRVGR